MPLNLDSEQTSRLKRLDEDSNPCDDDALQMESSQILETQDFLSRCLELQNPGNDRENSNAEQEISKRVSYDRSAARSVTSACNGESTTRITSGTCTGSARIPSSGEYLARLAGLPAPVLPFTSLSEAELLLSLLPSFFKRRRGKPTVVYSKLAVAYNKCVMDRLPDPTFSFKTTNYVKEFSENAMRVSLIEQATKRGTFVLTENEQKDIRQRFRKPSPIPVLTDPIPVRETQEQKGLHEQATPSAPLLHFAPRGTPVNYHAFYHFNSANLLASNESSAAVLLPRPVSNSLEHTVGTSRKKTDTCTLCHRIRFPKDASTGHRRDGYCPVKGTFSKRSATGVKICKLNSEARKRGICAVDDCSIQERFAVIQTKFPPEKRPRTVDELLGTCIPQ